VLSPSADAWPLLQNAHTNWWAGHKEELAAGLSAFALKVVTPGAMLLLLMMRNACHSCDELPFLYSLFCSC
jgi:hypothetical protein